ncbi:hypothetical protein M8J77_021831 [Diaphorina citri]|nr:hypothetical protein M8J77_021831 [Diaphorina citri]
MVGRFFSPIQEKPTIQPTNLSGVVVNALDFRSGVRTQDEGKTVEWQSTELGLYRLSLLEKEEKEKKKKKEEEKKEKTYKSSGKKKKNKKRKKKKKKKEEEKKKKKKNKNKKREKKKKNYKRSE